MKLIKYLYYRVKIQNLQDRIVSNFFTNFNKTHRATLYYMASKDLDYVFYKVYCLWGVDGLTDSEKASF